MIGFNHCRVLSLCLLGSCVSSCLHTPSAILGVSDRSRNRGSEEANSAEQWLAAPRVRTSEE